MSKALISETQLYTGERAIVLLWGFNVELRDRRTGESVKGAAVEIGDTAYDIEGAIERIEQKYSLLGFELLSATFESQKHYKLDAVKLFNELDDDEQGYKPDGKTINIKDLAGREYVKEDYSQWSSSNEAVEAALRELEGAE